LNCEYESAFWSVRSTFEFVAVFFVETEAENQLVKLADVIAIRPGGTEGQAAPHSSKSACSNIELSLVGTAMSFSLYHVRRASGHKLRQGHIVFHANDASVVTQWVDRISDMLTWPGSEHSVVHAKLYFVTIFMYIYKVVICYCRVCLLDLEFTPCPPVDSI